MQKKNTKKPNTIQHNYGQFAIEFEFLVLSMKRCIYTIFRNQGLAETKYLRIILHDQTASPIHAKLRSLLAIYFENEPEKLKVLEKLFSHTIKLIEKRNEIIHGNFFINISPVGDLYKDKITKSGLNQHREKFDLKTFRSYIRKVIRAKNIFEHLNIHIHDNKKPFEKFITEQNIAYLAIDSK